MAKETSISIRLVADLRNYLTGIKQSQGATKQFAKNVQQDFSSVGASMGDLMRGDIRALPALFQSATVAAGGFAKGLTAVKAALIATGIGAIIVALGLAIGSVTAYFRETEEGAIVWKKVMNTIKAYTEPVLNIFEALGKSIVMLLKGDFKGAWDNIATTVKGVGDEYRKNAVLLKEVNAITEVMDKKTREGKRNIAKLEREIAEARNKAQDEENYTAQQRAGYIAQAVNKTHEMFGIQRDLNQMETDYATKRAQMGDDDTETLNTINDLELRKDELYAEQESSLKRMLETQRSIGKEAAEQLAVQQLTAKQIAERATLGGMTQMTTRTNFESFGSAPSTELANMGTYMDSNTEKAYAMGAALDEAISQQKITNMQSLSQSFNTLGGAIGGVTGHFLNMASTILNLIPQLIAQIAAMTTAQVTSSTAISTAKGGEAIASGTAASQSLPFPFNLIALAATIGSIIAALATKPPKMAAGGLVYGDTIARVGEYSGARANPEVIAPLDKLKGILAGSQQQQPGMVFIPETRLKGEDIVISYNRAAGRINKRT